MKKLIQITDLSKQIETITAMDFRRNPGEVFDQVTLGKTFLISRNGRITAVIQRPPGDCLAMAVDKHGNLTYKLNS